MARSYFALFPGVMPPQGFAVNGLPELLTISDVWDHSRRCPPSLLFRVRSESDVGAKVSEEDRLESCVGVVDSAVRWRSIFNMTRSMLSAVRNPPLRNVCAQAMQFISGQHPAAVTQEQRNVLMGEIMRTAEGQLDDQPQPTSFENTVALYITKLVGSDSDIEASFAVPFVAALCPFDPEKQRQEYLGRMATIETMSGAVLITEAANRLAERMPQWIASQMPALRLDQKTAAAPRDREQDD